MHKIGTQQNQVFSRCLTYLAGSINGFLEITSRSLIVGLEASSVDLIIHLYVAMGRLDKACRLLTRKEHLEPRYQNLRAVCLALSGELRKAETVLEEAYASNPNASNILNNLGNIKILLREPQRAKELHLRAAQRSPLSPIPRYNLVLSYQACGEFEKALSSYYNYRFLVVLMRWVKITVAMMVPLGLLILTFLH